MNFFNIFIIQICELINLPELKQPVVINDFINMVFWDFLQSENIDSYQQS